MILNQALSLAAEIHQDLAGNYPFLNDWTLVLDSAKRRAGACMTVERRISISRWHIQHNDLLTVKDTILHEFAHSIAFNLYGETGHGRVWQQVAQQIGARPQATGRFNLPDAPWSIVTRCLISEEIDFVAYRYRKKKGLHKYALKGRPGTQGQLFYLCSEQLSQYRKGNIQFSALKFIR